MQHEHGLLCNAGFSALDRGVQVRAGRALMWFARGTRNIHRLWLTDDIELHFADRHGDPASASARQGEYRLQEYEFALHADAVLVVNGQRHAGDRLEYSLRLGRVVGRH